MNFLETLSQCITLAVLEMYAKLKDQMKNRRLATSFCGNELF